MSSLKEGKRSYTITNELDDIHTTNGRCPNYALTWNELDNRKYWPEGHDYFMGNGNNINDETKVLREILSKRLLNGSLSKYIIFCDLDGVLADFVEGVLLRLKKKPDELKPSYMWSVINKSNTFFEKLPWMPKGKELWKEISKYNPIILTGVPSGNKSIIEQKIRWCERELGPDVQVITCSTKDKTKYCLYQSILIDDRTDNLQSWNDKGGKFILYDEDYLDSIIERIHKHMNS